MGSIFYIMRKTVKNAVVDTFRHPLRLILYGMIGLSLIYAIITGFTANAVTYDETKDTRALYGAYLALLYFISIPIMLKGLSTGTSFFSMGDVNNIFVAPISSKKILTYGIGRQLASMLFLVVCFSAYGGMVMRVFRLSVANAVLLVGGILSMLILVQMITLLIFCLSSGHPKRATFLKYCIYLIPIYALAVVGIYMFSNGMTLENLFFAISNPILEFAPVIGWLHGLVFGIIDNNITNIIIYGTSLLIVVCASICVFVFSKLDYYEDVLERAESNFEFRESLRTGTVSDSVMLGNKKINLRKTGIGRGKGAATIFYKHLREGSRRSRFMFFNINTVVLLGTALVVGMAMKDIFVFHSARRLSIIYISVTIICSYIQFFFSAAGDWVKELGKPYIFLIPDNPVKKLIMAGATSIIKPFVDGTIAYVALSILIGGWLTDIITCILVYGSFGCVYISANILAQRIVGMNGNRGIFITFYMSLIFLLMIPGIFLGVWVLTYARWFSFIAATIMGIPIFLWNIFISLMIFLTCKNLLNNVE